MNRSAVANIFLSILAVVFAVPCAIQLTAQQPSANRPSQSFAERLGFGKSMYVKNEHGTGTAFDAIESDIQGWGRFTLLDAPDKADLIAEVTSYGSGSVRVGDTTNYATPDGKPEYSSGASKDLSTGSVNLRVYDAKTKRELWSGTEKVKTAFKKKSEQDNTLAAAEKLFRRFHDAVEPPQ
ncbi:MAG TPA: hypothetical protein VG498_23790 [Terriglobales bacterium]|nr:hypothetical protein [Terriglobales bacterium]